MTVSAPAAAEQLRTIACGGVTPVTGAWRPPFAQAYTWASAVRPRVPPDLPPVAPAHRAGPGRRSRDRDRRGVAAGRVTFAGTDGRVRQRRRRRAVDTPPAPRVISRYAHLASVSVTGRRHRRRRPTARGRRLHRRPAPATTCTSRSASAGRRSTRCRSCWPTAHPSTATPWPARTPPARASRVQEGGVGFRLPPPGTPRQDSLHNPALPIPAEVNGLPRGRGTGTRSRGRCWPGSGWRRPPTAATPAPAPPARRA